MKSTAIKPVSTPAAYMGGKRLLAKRICALIDTIPHTTYAEAFVGMGGIFFKRHSQPKAEVINDYSKDVANLFRILQRHYPQFMDTLRFQISSRHDFNRLKAANPDTLTDLENAARFLYLQRMSFGGKVSGRSFGVNAVDTSRWNMNKLPALLDDVHERLGGVTIECLDFREFIKRYDREGTLFYLDPPYYGHENDYGKEMFLRNDFTDLATLLREIKGTFILSLNDRPEVRDIFAGFNFMEVETRYSAGGNDKGKKVGELLISNHPLE